MIPVANPVRGEASLRVAGEVLVLRPTFAALVAAEQELGSLFALVERAVGGRLALAELVALFWHCLLYTSDAADESSRVDLGGRRIIKKKRN